MWQANPAWGSPRIVAELRKLGIAVAKTTVVLAHDRRRIVHFNVTEHPTAQWTAQQLVEAFPFDCAPRYLLWDGDGIYGERVLPFGHTSEGLKAWVSRRPSRRRLRPGKTPMLND
jgi:hypothetical protein